MFVGVFSVPIEWASVPKSSFVVLAFSSLKSIGIALALNFPRTALRNDVYGPVTRAQYYLHAHPQTRGKWSDYGHFRTFGRAPGNWSVVGERYRLSSDDGQATNGACHLIAISMNRSGRQSGYSRRTGG